MQKYRLHILLRTQLEAVGVQRWQLWNEKPKKRKRLVRAAALLYYYNSKKQMPDAGIYDS